MGIWRGIKHWFDKPVPVIDLDVWNAATKHYRFMAGLSTEEQRRLRLIASDFLAHKSIIGAAGLEISTSMKVEIAAQASILVLELGLEVFDGWHDIIVYPGQFMPEREVVDEIGVVHTTRDPLAGEAWLGGPVILSYEDVERVGTQHAIDGFNVVIHEFAHKLDMRNGDANGFPPLHKHMLIKDWQEAFKAAYLDFCRRVDDADASADVDAGAALDALPIDPYASESPAEFFAVMSEAFFELPAAVKQNYPLVYEQLCLYYRQDPDRRQTAKA
jgi:MtfA peptidase